MSYRSVNFRDAVLWELARMIGLDPADELLTDQANSFVGYVNKWVRKTWDSTDWPEWTKIEQFTPDANHIVPYQKTPASTNINPFAVVFSRVFKMYLRDPGKVPGVLDSPFTLRDTGVHCGFEHGTSVWLKYIGQAPQFTAEEWSATKKYAQGALTYSPVTGECYVSLINNNVGNDPAFEMPPTDFGIDQLQPFIPGNPGNPVPRPKIMELALLTDVAIPDPHPAGGVFQATIHDTSGVIISFHQYVNLTSMPLATILTNWAALFQGDPGLSTFTITVDTTRLVIRFSDESDFTITRPDGIDPATYHHDTADSDHFLANYVVQPYFPVMSATPATPQLVKLSIASNQVFAGGTYVLTFNDITGVAHNVQYVAGQNDDSVQILYGLAVAIGAANVTDPFFQSVQTSLDNVTPALTIITKKEAGINAQVQQPSNQQWLLIPFPFALVDSVLRGAYAESLKEAGQVEKAAPEEQAVTGEITVRAGSFLAPTFDKLTDQQQPKPHATQAQ